MGDLVERAILRSKGFESGLWAAKLGFICIGIVSTVILFKLAVIPYAVDFIFSFLSAVPTFWFSIKAWLSPPYIYIILNFIIITIAASSSLHHHNHPNQTKRSKAKISFHTHLNRSRSGENIWNENNTEEEKGGGRDEDGEEQVENPSLSMDKHDDVSEEISLKGEETMETLEETWKMITEGKKKKERTLKKSDTWETPPPRVVLRTTGNVEEEDKDAVAWAQRELRKSETFNDTTSLRREKSMSQDELNQRVEAFIKNFNKQIRLQREESEQRFLEKVKSGIEF
ncbi:uncharacterized protein LOC110810071 [Carica papaya]|uniref:uncharacterized protein LOC110810071 n=1 Tax=Carica papaya TaxID=3649 RepID=UPI000B8CA3F3|nr:uncharacterized protein LOC110810071 [Carica papaya]